MNYVVKYVGVKPFHFCLLIALLVILSACDIADKPQATQQIKATHLVTLELKAGDTQTSVQAAYGGEIIAWTDAYAVLRFTHDSDISSAALSSGTVEQNAKDFSADGVLGFNGSRAWAGGSRAWAGGSRAWAGGEFGMMPENTQAWLQVGLDEAYKLAPNLGYGIKVAIIDTGVDLKHPALIEALAPQNEWKDFVDGDNYPQEEGVLGTGAYGHGTLIAGIVRQIAPAATILPIRVLDKDGSGYLSDLVSAIDWARKQGADVINLSLGSKSYSFSVDITMGFAAGNNVTMVSSTGNTGDEQVVFPAFRAPNYLSGFNRLSVTSVNSKDIKSDFATFGSTVELAAPGEAIFGPAPDMRMAGWSGTSMAAPVASGALALALGETTNVTQAKLLENLQASATDVSKLKGNQAFISKLGSGRINIAAFLKRVLE